MKTADLIVQYLKDKEWARSRQIAATIKKSSAMVFRALNKMVQKGDLYKTGQWPHTAYSLKPFTENPILEEPVHDEISLEIIKYVKGGYAQPHKMNWNLGLSHGTLFKKLGKLVRTGQLAKIGPRFNVRYTLGKTQTNILS